MQAQIPHPQSWFELRGSAVEFNRDDVSLRFVLLQRGDVRGGAWFVEGRPVMFIPAGDA